MQREIRSQAQLRDICLQTLKECDGFEQVDEILIQHATRMLAVRIGVLLDFVPGGQRRPACRARHLRRVAAGL